MNSSVILQSALPKRLLARDILHLFVLSSFAIAQPLFDIFSQYAGFFIAHKSEPVELLSFTIFILIAVPLSLSLVELVAVVLNRNLRIFIHFLFVGILVFMIVLPILGTIAAIGPFYQVLAAAIICILVCRLYWSSSLLSTFLNFISPAILAFPALFLMGADIQAIVFKQSDQQFVSVDIENPVPIVLVVFDEFNGTAVMNEHHRIDHELFPTLAQFSSKAHWFRNATGVSDGTYYAVPAISTGLYASKRQPTYHDYPQSLFSVLGDTYKYNVFESVTRLCPDLHCAETPGQKKYPERMINLLSDASIVYFHILVPDEYTESLPAINQGWTNFTQPEMPEEKASHDDSSGGWMNHVGDNLNLDRISIFRNFIDRIPAPEVGPSLNYMHVLLPHAPYQYLPSGKNYGAFPLSGLQRNNREKWGGDEWAILQSWQRSQLQIAFTDTLLGELFESLKNKDMFEESLIIVTADHGVSFRANEYRRVGTKSNYMDILSVPLFIKLPHQKQGVVSDANIETIDIFPTIADLMEIELPLEVDGSSVFDNSEREGRTKKRLYIDSSAKDIFAPGDLPERYNALDRRLSLFGSNNLIDKLFSLGPDKQLIGRKSADLIIQNNMLESSIQLDGNYLSRNFDGKTGPNYIKGILFREESAKENSRLALVINGTIRAVTRTLKSTQDGRHEFVFLVPEEAYEVGMNNMEVMAIIGDDGGSISPLEFTLPLTYQLQQSSDGMASQLMDSSGKAIPITPGALRGYIDTFSFDNELIELKGWAADIQNKTLPELVVVFINNEYIHSVRPGNPRNDVVVALNEPAFQFSGYSLAVTVPDKYLNTNFDLEVYAVSKSNVASQLIASGRVIAGIKASRSSP